MEELLKALTEALGLTEPLTEATAAETIKSHYVAATTASDAVKAELATSQTALETSQIDLAAAVAKAPVDPKPLDPDTLELLVEGADAGLDSLVTNLNITPAARAKLGLVLVGPATDRNALCLSKTVSGTPQALVKGVVDALKDNDPVELGQKMGAQTLSLGPAAGPDADAELAKITTGMSAMANAGRE